MDDSVKIGVVLCFIYTKRVTVSTSYLSLSLHFLCFVPSQINEVLSL